MVGKIRMSISFSDYLDSYMQFCRVEKLLSANTIESYERDLRSFEQYLNEHGITSLQKVNSNDLIDYLEWLQNVKLLDNSSISRHNYLSYVLLTKTEAIQKFLNLYL